MISSFGNIKDKKGIEILLKVIERRYRKSPGMQKLKNESMIDVCKEEGVPTEQVFFYLLLGLSSWAI